MIYLASPYSHPEPDVMECRYEVVMRITARLIVDAKLIVYSPIVHCHVMAIKHQLPKDAEFWKVYNLGVLQKCDSLWVAKLSGWEQSKGVLWEIEQASQLNKPIKFIHPMPQD